VPSYSSAYFQGTTAPTTATDTSSAVLDWDTTCDTVGKDSVKGL
jgi:hypothetical protein